MSERNKAKAAIAVIVLALAVYFVALGERAIVFLGDDRIGVKLIGAGVLVFPLLGVWMVWMTLRNAMRQDRIARRTAADGRELDTEDLPRMPSGRVERAAADELFAKVKAEWEQNPDDWQVNYRLARAYDVAGDRSRAREIMRRAVELEARAQTQARPDDPAAGPAAVQD